MRMLLISLLLLTACLFAVAVDNQAFLGIFAETSANRVAGMPDMSAMLKDLPPGMKIPESMMMGMPKRQLTVRLWSPGLAAQDAFAWLAVPEGLKLGKRLNLGLYRPTAEKAGGKEVFDPSTMPEFTIIRYWGSSPKVKTGQPDVMKFDGMSDQEKAAIREQSNKARNEYYYKPDWTTGYWPTNKQPGRIDADVALVGNYALTTNYTGNVAIDVPDTVNFLNPIELSAPDLTQQLDLTQPITFKWKTIPGVLGYHAYIVGMKDQNTLITWSSSEVKRFDNFGWDYMQMSEVIQQVNATAMMAPTRTEVTVPAGIFNGCDFVNFMMIGYGTGAALGEGQPIPRVQTKTVLSVMLGGTKMKNPNPGNRRGMGGMPNMRDVGEVD